MLSHRSICCANRLRCFPFTSTWCINHRSDIYKRLPDLGLNYCMVHTAALELINKKTQCYRSFHHCFSTKTSIENNNTSEHLSFESVVTELTKVNSTLSKHDDFVETQLREDQLQTEDGEVSMLLESMQQSNRKLEHLQRLLCYSDSDFVSVIRKLPRLRFKQCTQKVITNSKLLLQQGYSIRFIRSMLQWKTSCAILLQCDREDLRTTLKQENHSGKLLTKKSLCTDLEKRIMGSEEDHLELVSGKLQCSRAVLLDMVGKQDLYFIQKQSHPSLLREKMDYLVSEGISLKEIASFMPVLRYSMETVHESICRIKSEYGEVNLSFLRSLLFNKNTRTNPKRNNPVMKILGISSRNKLTPCQRQFIGTVNTVTAMESFRFLRDNHFSDNEIRRCFYILGHAVDDIKEAWDLVKEMKEFNFHDQNKLINAILYIIEFQIKS